MEQKCVKYIFILNLIVFTALLIFTSCIHPDNSWDMVLKILNQIAPPSFPDKKFSIVEYGARGDGRTDCTEAFKKAIHDCHKSGGGKIVVPEGIYLTGAIHLKSNINLHITKNATILFSQDPEKYLPPVYTRFEGVECINYSPFIYAYEQENIAITGNGILDGQAGPDNWWPWCGSEKFGWEQGNPNCKSAIKKLFQMAEDQLPIKNRLFGKGNYLRPNFIQLYKCKNILIDSITVKNSPMWIIHPVLCKNVIIQNTKIISHGPNNDGCNPESSRNVWIKNCYFDTGDDCIAIKSGRNADGRRINSSSENILIQKCIMKNGHGGIVIGSEVSGNVRNIFAEECMMDSPNLQRAFRIKTNSIRGGIVENIYVRNCTIGEVAEAIFKINYHYDEGDTGKFTPIVQNIYINNITSNKSLYALYFTGYERSPISNIFIQDCNFNNVKQGNIIKFCTNIIMTNVKLNSKYQ